MIAQSQTPCPICCAIEALRETGLGGYARELEEYRQTKILPMVDQLNQFRDAMESRSMGEQMLEDAAFLEQVLLEEMSR